MASITVRIPPHIRDALQARADEERESLSDFVRNLLLGAVIESSERAEGRAARRIDSLTLMDRQTLALLHRILARVLPEDSNDVDGDEAYQLEQAAVLEQGFAGEYSAEFQALAGELTTAQCDFVVDVLSMFQMIQWSIEEASSGEGEPLTEAEKNDLKFQGFDFNDPLEGHMGAYVRHLVTQDRWAEQVEFVHNSNERGNSHMPMRGVYSRMLAEYRSGEQRRLTRRFGRLNLQELKAIAASLTPPSNR